MKDLTTFDEVLKFAISLEEKAVRFYSDLAKKATTPTVKKVCDDLAKEEQMHKEKLEDVQKIPTPQFKITPVNNLKIAEVLQDVDFSSGDFSYQKALTVAMKREKFSLELYTQLAADATDPKLKELFSYLAVEEGKHKHKIEVEYDEVILKDN